MSAVNLALESAPSPKAPKSSFRWGSMFLGVLLASIAFLLADQVRKVFDARQDHPNYRPPSVATPQFVPHSDDNVETARLKRIQDEAEAARAEIAKLPPFDWSQIQPPSILGSGVARNVIPEGAHFLPRMMEGTTVQRNVSSPRKDK